MCGSLSKKGKYRFARPRRRRAGGLRGREGGESSQVIHHAPGKFNEGATVAHCRHASDVEAEVDDVALLHDVVFAFEAEEALLAGGGVGAGAGEVVVGDNLGADEAALDVGVDG